MNGRAQTPEQKRAVLDRLHAAWLKAPEQRLGQLLENAMRHGPPVLFYREDDALAAAVEAFTDKRFVAPSDARARHRIYENGCFVERRRNCDGWVIYAESQRQTRAAVYWWPMGETTVAQMRRMPTETELHAMLDFVLGRAGYPAAPGDAYRTAAVTPPDETR